MPSSKSEFQDISNLDAFKQLFHFVEKKKRNLEKKKNKLEEYRKKQEQGETLNSDQLKAVEKFDGVIQSIELVKEVLETAQQLNSENEKNIKKAAKKEKQERERMVSDERERYCRESVLNIFHIQSILNDLGNPDVRQWFVEGLNGAEQLTSNELSWLDALYTLLNPTREAYPESEGFDGAILTATEHALNLVEGIDKTIFDTTYSDLNQLFERIRNCPLYKLNTRPAPVVVQDTAAVHQNGMDVENEDEINPTTNVEFTQNEPTFDKGDRLDDDNSLELRSEVNHQHIPTTASSRPVKESIDEVLLPLRSSFNFLQLSEVSRDTSTLIKNSSMSAAEPDMDFARSGLSHTGVSHQGDSSDIDSSHQDISRKKSFEKESWSSSSWSNRAKQDDSYFNNTSLVATDQKIDGEDINQSGGDVFSSASQSAFLQPEDDQHMGSLRGYGGGRGRGSRGGSRGGRDQLNRDSRGGYRGSRGGSVGGRGGGNSGRGGGDYRGGSRSGYRSDRGGGRGGPRGGGASNKDQDGDQRKSDGKPREFRKDYYRGNSNGDYSNRNGGSNRGGVYNNREKQ